MKRDMDLFRSLMLEIESFDLKNRPDTIQRENVLDEIVQYHLWLLMQSGYITATDASAGDDLWIFVGYITPTGQDFLDTIRDDTVWERTQEQVVKTVGTTSLEIIKAVATAVTKGMLGLP